MSIRQPFAELILRGIKTVEYRTRPTRIIGERFWIYASRGRSQKPGASSQKIWSGDLSFAKDLPEWMIELAEQVGMIEPGALLPTGVIVGSAVIEKCAKIEDRESKIDQPSSILYPRSSMFRWHLADVERVSKLKAPERHPQPVWFQPF